MYTRPIPRFELVELLINQASNRINFNDIPQLRWQEGQQIYIRNIEVFPVNVYANSQVNNAVVGVPNTELIKAVLVLYVQGEERMHYIPLHKLIHINSDPAAFIPFQQEQNEFDDLQRVEWPKSYVQFSAVPVPTYVIPFGITYQKVIPATSM